MMKLRVLLTMFVLLVPLAGQETKKDDKFGQSAPRRKDWVTQVIPVKHVDMSSLLPLIKPLGVQVDLSGAFQSLIVSGPPEAVSAAEAITKQFDVPSPVQRTRNIELTVYLMAGMAQTAEKDSLPRELDSVVMQLRSLFPYQGYRILDTAILRARNGGTATVSGSMQTPGSNQTATYSIDTRRIQIAPDVGGNVVRLDMFNVVVMLLGTPDSRAIGRFTTNLDVREGQKVVVGKANIDGTTNALILVVTAKVVD